MLFYIFIRDMDDRTECTFGNFVDVAKLGRVADDCAIIQRYFVAFGEIGNQESHGVPTKRNIKSFTRQE